MQNYALSLYLQVSWGFFSHFCSCFLSLMLPIRPCFPSRCPWKGEMPEFVPESLSLFFGKTRFLTCVTCSTCPSQAGDNLRDFVQQGWMLLSEGFFHPSLQLMWPLQIFFCLLWGENSPVLHSSRFVQEQVCVSRCIPGWLKLSLTELQSWSHPSAGLRSPRCLDQLVEHSWQRQQLLQQFLGSKSETGQVQALGSPLQTVRWGDHVH